MMRHLLTDPAFPDIVGEWAAAAGDKAEPAAPANDNLHGYRDDLSDPLITMIAKLEIARTRLW